MSKHQAARHAEGLSGFAFSPDECGKIVRIPVPKTCPMNQNLEVIVDFMGTPLPNITI
jgi:hypothetical protein